MYADTLHAGNDVGLCACAVLTTVALHSVPTVLQCLGYSSSVCMILGAGANYYYVLEGNGICGWCIVTALVFDRAAPTFDQKGV